MVTGAGRGLGRALAMDLGRRGAQVVVSDVDEAAAADTAAAMTGAGFTAHAVACDVSDAAAVDALAEAARGLVGPVDVIVNNAGVAVAGRFERISLEDWRFAVDVNLWGTIHGCRAFVPPML
ncbi:MAG: short-chain dehydrogenase, partial [Proteobacteria bacterium]